MTPGARPPQLARGLLSRLLPTADRSEILDDLDERFRARPDRGGASARSWYRSQVLTLGVWAVGRRLAALLSRVTGLFTDLRVAARGLRRNPTYSIVAVLTLALGIGGNTAMFSLVDRVLLRPLPFDHPEELVAIHETRRGETWWAAAAPNALAWQERSRVLEDVAWSRPGRVSIVLDREVPRSIGVVRTSENALRLLGVVPAQGRFFRPEDTRGEAAAVAVVSHAFWMNELAADAAAVGSRVVFDGVPHTVIGVIPEGQAPDVLGDARVVLPLAFTETDITTRSRTFRVIGRLADGVTLAAAQTEMSTLAATLDSEAPAGSVGGWGVELVPLRDQTVGDVRSSLLLLFGAVGFVLLIACVNLANLVLARGHTRAPELAIRRSLGAGRAHLVGLLVAESLILALAGGVVGIGLVALVGQALFAIDPSVLPRIDGVGMDARVLIFTAGLAASVGLLLGLLPALSITDVRSTRAVAGATRQRTGTRSERRIGGALVALEVGLVVTLLVGAGGMLEGMRALVRTDPGFTLRDRVAARLTLPDTRYPDARAIARFVEDLTQRTREIPSVLSAGTVSMLPLTGSPGYTSLHIAPPPGPGDEPSGGIEIVGPGYFEAMGIGASSGRLLDHGDGVDGLPVTVVNEILAARLGDGEPLTDAIRTAPQTAGDAARWRDVVGVVPPVRYGLGTEARPRIYVPEDQAPFAMRVRFLVAHTRPGETEQAIEALRQAVIEVDPLLSVDWIDTLESVGRASIARERLRTVLVTTFAVLALVLGAVGVYGVVAYTVEQRRREVGLRMALGAGRADVLGDVMWRALRPVAIGLTGGLLLSLWLHRMLGNLDVGVESGTVVPFAAAPLILLLVASWAALLPAVRASRVDPMRVLRME